MRTIFVYIAALVLFGVLFLAMDAFVFHSRGLSFIYRG